MCDEWFYLYTEEKMASKSIQFDKYLYIFYQF